MTEDAPGRSSALDKYAHLGELSEYAKPEIAWKVCHQMLMENPNDPRALTAAAFIMGRLGALPQAYHFGRSAVQISPKEPVAWINFGHTASELGLTEEAQACYQTALKLAKSEEIQSACLLNLGGLYVDNGLFERGEQLTQALLKRDPSHLKARQNLSLCKLARRDWSGWDDYRLLIGSPLRPRVVYKNEPEWDGTPGKTVVLYAEQGLGDEISFASMVADAAQISRKVIVDCDGRLAGLFRRSFPNVTVYGTRVDATQWAHEDREFDCSLPIGQLGEFFRREDASFPGTPYLKACPVRTEMWSRQWTKPAIGIAWTGGIPRNNGRHRQVSLEQLAPLFALDAHFVSLQYKDARGEIEKFHVEHPQVDLQQYPWATLTHDYDDTAALVASLDAVVCIQTAVAHTAGALGVPVYVLVPKTTSWRYGHSGDHIPWYRSMTVIRQAKPGQWGEEIERATAAVRTHLGRLSSPAAEPARDGDVRRRLHLVRPAGESDHRANGCHAPA